MKKMVSFLCVILLLVSSVTGCAVSEKDTKYKTQYCLDEVVSVGRENADGFHFTELLNDTIECKRLSEIDEEEIRRIEKSLYEYLIKAYDLNWEFKSTEILMLDFSQVSENYEYFAAIADPKYETVYVNSGMIKTLDELTYRVAHELIHCLRYYNIGTLEYVYTDKNGNYFGYQLGESYTDIVVSKFLETLGEEAPLDYFLEQSSYCYTTVALQIIEKSIPNGDKMYLENNMQEFYESLKILTEKYIVDADKSDYALKFLYQADLIIITTKSIMNNLSHEEYINMVTLLLYSVYGNYEIALSISDSLNESGEKEAIDMEKLVEKLKICLE